MHGPQANYQVEIPGVEDTSCILLFLPSYPDMPCVAQNLSVSIEDSEVSNIIESVQSLGEVQMLGSLQIVELQEQAGGILVQWDEVHNHMDNFTSGLSKSILKAGGLHYQSFCDHRRNFA